jgi:type VI secretion system protein ImpC
MDNLRLGPLTAHRMNCSMPDSTKRGCLNLQFSARNAITSSSRSEKDQLRILILGDFGGQSPIVRQSGQSSDSIRVDYDNFDDVLSGVGPVAHLGTGEELPSAIQFRSLEDFHPDQVLSNFEPLSRLVELRKRLVDPSTASATGRQVQELLQFSAAPSEAPGAISGQPPDDLLNHLLSKPVSDRSHSTSQGSPVDYLIKQILGTPSDAVSSEEHKVLRTALEKELSKRLRDTLRHPAFQSLEATWRGLDFLVRNDGENTIFRLSDISRSALSALVSGDSDDTPITRSLTAFRPALVLGIYRFESEDRSTLSAIARICETHQTAFVAGASPELAGWTSFPAQPGRIPSLAEDREIASLRQKPEANHLGLILPRFLLRQAYGIRSDPIETFPFEEIDARPDHEFHLWGNSAFLCGYLLSHNFGESGWDFDPGQGGEISGLPVQQIVSDGETDMKPCAEAWLSERAGEAIRSRGIIPVLSIRGRDAVRITSLHSISAPPRNLAVRGP